MPLINIAYATGQASEAEMKSLSLAVRKIVSKEIGLKDVHVELTDSKAKAPNTPIEIFMQLNSYTTPKRLPILKLLKEQLQQWKEKHNFNCTINLTVVRVAWDTEKGI